MSSRSRPVVPLILLPAFPLLSPPLSSHATSTAPTPPTAETVFVTTHEDDDIVRIDLAAGTARTIIDAHDASGSERTFRGLAVRQEGSAIPVVAADKARAVGPLHGLPGDDAGVQPDAPGSGAALR